MANYRNPGPETLAKWKLVAEEYLVNGHNQTQAYCKYYPNTTPESARCTASCIFNTPQIKEYLAERRKEIHDALCIDTQHLADELMKIALSDDEKVRPSDKINALKILYQAAREDEKEARGANTTEVVIRIEDDDNNADTKPV